jgi:hypothetical protein
VRTKTRGFKAVRLDDARLAQMWQIEHILHFHALSPLREWRATQDHSRVSTRGETKRGRRRRDGFASLSPRHLARSDVRVHSYCTASGTIVKNV